MERNEQLETIQRVLRDRGNYYKVLQIDRNFQPDVLTRQKRRLSKFCHPDKNRDIEQPQLAEEAMKIIHEAFDTLSDPKKREEYDTRMFYEIINEIFTRSSDERTNYENFSPANETPRTRSRTGSTHNTEPTFEREYDCSRSDDCWCIRTTLFMACVALYIAYLLQCYSNQPPEFSLIETVDFHFEYETLTSKTYYLKGTGEGTSTMRRKLNDLVEREYADMKHRKLAEDLQIKCSKEEKRKADYIMLYEKHKEIKYWQQAHYETLASCQRLKELYEKYSHLSPQTKWMYMDKLDYLLPIFFVAFLFFCSSWCRNYF